MGDVVDREMLAIYIQYMALASVLRYYGFMAKLMASGMATLAIQGAYVVLLMIGIFLDPPDQGSAQ